MKEILIDEFEKNNREKVMISIKEFKKNYYLDVRVYFENKEGEYSPSKKGITISLELLDDLKEAIEKVEKELNKGILDKIK